MTLPLMRLMSLLGAPILGTGFVASAMLLPGLVVRSIGPRQAVAASPFESEVVEATPSLFNRSGGGRSTKFSALLEQQSDPLTQSAVNPTPALSVVQDQGARLNAALIPALSDELHVSQNKVGAAAARSSGTMSASSGGATVSSGSSATSASASTSVASVSQAASSTRAASAGQVFSGSSPKPASGDAGMAGNIMGQSASTGSDSTTPPPLAQFQFLSTLQSAGTAGSGRSAATPSR